MKHNRIYINTFHADIHGEVTDVVVFASNKYTGNALADEMKKQMAAHFQVMYYADVLQMEITTKNT